MEHYLAHIALFSNGDVAEQGDKVKLMTVHAAKGLEFPYVFLCGMNEGIFPSRKVRTLPGMEEERRLCYVAMTRAKEKLICVQCMAHGRKRLADLSVLADMPTPPEAVAGAKCPGDWLLLPLLCAPEGEPLRRWAEAEPQTRVGLGGGWQVQVWENPTAAAAREREDAPQEALPERSFRS